MSGDQLAFSRRAEQRSGTKALAVLRKTVGCRHYSRSGESHSNWSQVKTIHDVDPDHFVHRETATNPAALTPAPAALALVIHTVTRYETANPPADCLRVLATSTEFHLAVMVNNKPDENRFRRQHQKLFTRDAQEMQQLEQVVKWRWDSVTTIACVSIVSIRGRSVRWKKIWWYIGGAIRWILSKNWWSALHCWWCFSFTIHTDCIVAMREF